MLTWQYATLAPAAAMIWLFADLTPGRASSSLPAALSAAQLIGVGGGGFGGLAVVVAGQISAKPDRLAMAIRKGATRMGVPPDGGVRRIRIRRCSRGSQDQVRLERI